MSRTVRVQPEPLRGTTPMDTDAQVGGLTSGACGTRTKIDNRAQATIRRLREAQLTMAGSLTFPNTDKKPAKFAQMPAGLNKTQVDGASSWFQSVHCDLPFPSLRLDTSHGEPFPAREHTQRPCALPQPKGAALVPTPRRESCATHYLHHTGAVDTLTSVWRLPHARVLISVTGGAAGFRIDKRLKASFQRGLKAAVRTILALILALTLWPCAL